MKKAIAYLFLGLIFSQVKGQSTLGVDSIGYSINDSTYFGNTDAYQFSMHNYGPQVVSGPVQFFVGVDSSAGGGTVLLTKLDSMMATIAVNSSVTFTTSIGIGFSGTSDFRSGINTVVIWPRQINSITTFDSLKVPVWVLGTFGIKNFEKPEKAIVFPNPVMDKLFISHNEKDFTIQTIKIFDLNSRLVSTESFKGYLDLHKLNSGTYYIEFISSEGKNLSYKIIKE